MNESFTKYYVDQANSAISGVFHSPLTQRGYGQTGGGIGNMLKSFMRWITPLTKTHILPSVQEGLKTVGNQVVDSLAGFAKDTIEGKTIKNAANDRYNETIQTLKKKAEEKFNGRGLKRKKSINKTKKYKNTIILKKTKNNSRDIFD